MNETVCTKLLSVVHTRAVPVLPYTKPILMPKSYGRQPSRYVRKRGQRMLAKREQPPSLVATSGNSTSHKKKHLIGEMSDYEQDRMRGALERKFSLPCGEFARHRSKSVHKKIASRLSKRK